MAMSLQDEIKKLREAFTSLDKNGDGLLTFLGSLQALKVCGFTCGVSWS